MRARHVFSGSTTFQGEQVEMPLDGGQKWCVLALSDPCCRLYLVLRTRRIRRELRYIGRWERKKLSEQGSGLALGVPFRSQIAVSVSQNVRPFLNTLGFRYVLLSLLVGSVAVRLSLSLSRALASTHSHSYRYMRLGTRWQLPNGITIEATRMKAVRLSG